MTTRQKIISQLNRIDNPELLHEIDKWIESILDMSNPEQFPKAEITDVLDGYKQYRTGTTIDQSEAKRLFIEWLIDKTGKRPEISNFDYPQAYKELYGSVDDESFTIPNR